MQELVSEFLNPGGILREHEAIDRTVANITNVIVTEMFFGEP